MGLQNIIIDKLKEYGLKLGIVETSTSGMICSNLATLKDYEDIFRIGLVMSDQLISWKFGLNEENYFSQQNARKLAKYLHDEYECDIVLSVLSTQNDSNLKELDGLDVDEKYQNNPNSHAFISILVIDRYSDFELKFKYEEEMRHRMTISAKAINELISVLIKLK